MAVGRLADPNCTLGTDPRSDPRMVAALAPLGLADVLPASPLTLDTPLADRLAYAAGAEDAAGGAIARMAPAADEPAGVTTTTATNPGADGNEITLYIS